MNMPVFLGVAVEVRSQAQVNLSVLSLVALLIKFSLSEKTLILVFVLESFIN